MTNSSVVDPNATAELEGLTIGLAEHRGAATLQQYGVICSKSPWPVGTTNSELSRLETDFLCFLLARLKMDASVFYWRAGDG